MPRVAPSTEPTDPRELALKYDRLAWRIALRHRHRLQAGSDFDDLAQVCRQYVYRAALRWDRTRGVCFMTYAWRSVISGINRHLVLERRRGLTAVGDSSRLPGRPKPRAVGVFNETHAESVLAAGGASATLAEFAVAPEAGDGGGYGRLSVRFWERVVVGLTPNEAAALVLRYRDGLTLQAAGERMGLSKERIRQLCVRAVQKIRERNVLDELVG